MLKNNAIYLKFIYYFIIGGRKKIFCENINGKYGIE